MIGRKIPSHKKRYTLNRIALSIVYCVVFLTAISTHAEVPQSIKERHKSAQDFMRAKVAVILASDSKGPSHHNVAHYVKEVLENKGHTLISSEMVDNEESALQKAIGKALNNKANTILVIGGTGIASRDNTLEVVEPLFSKRLPGYGEMLRFLSYEKWQDLIEKGELPLLNVLTRATAGIINGGQAVLFTLPGSPDGVELGLTKIILPVLPNIIYYLEVGDDEIKLPQ